MKIVKNIYISSAGVIGQYFSEFIEKKLSHYEVFNVFESYKVDSLSKTKELISKCDIVFFLICSEYGVIKKEIKISKQEYEYELVIENNLTRLVYLIDDEYEIPLKNFEQIPTRLRKFKEFKLKIKEKEEPKVFFNEKSLFKEIYTDLTVRLNKLGYHLLKKQLQLIKYSEYNIFSSLELKTIVQKFEVRDLRITDLSLKRKSLEYEIDFDSLTELDYLESLELDYLSINLNKNIEKFVNLISLKITNCNIEKLPIELFNLKKLKKLDLSNNKIKKIPREILKLENLIKLDLSENEITICPSWIWQIFKLESFKITGNMIRKLPETIYNFKALTEIYISRNKINSLPIILYNTALNFGDMQYPEVMDLFKNDIKKQIVKYIKIYFDFLISKRLSPESNIRDLTFSFIKKELNIENIKLFSLNDNKNKDYMEYEVNIHLYFEFYDLIRELIEFNDIQILERNCTNMLPNFIDIRGIRFKRIESPIYSKHNEKHELELNDISKIDVEKVVTILHISDMHIRTSELAENYDIAFNKMIETIEFELDDDWKPKMILITGDITWSASKKEYILANEYISNLCNNLKIKTNDLIICPGNHDVYQKSVLKNKLKYPKDHSEADSRLTYEKLISHSDVQPFENFIEFCENLKIDKKEIKTSPDSWQNYLIGQNNKEDLSLISLNTAWFSYEYTYKKNYFKKKSNGLYVCDKGKLWLGKPLIDTMYSKNQITSTKRSKSITISLMHHPYYFLHEIEYVPHIKVGRLTTFSRIKECSNIILFGHTHANDIYDPDILESKTLYLNGGAFYDGFDNINIFSLYNIDIKNRELKRKTFKWNIMKGYWEEHIFNFRDKKWNILC